MDSYLCINGTFKGIQNEKIPHLPKKGEIYTLIEEYENPIGESGYVFKELPNPPLKNGLVPNFRKSRFVPVDKEITIELVLNEEYAE